MTKDRRMLTVPAWSDEIGISRQAGYVALKRCGIPQDDAGRIDADLATMLYRERTRPRVKVRAAPPAEPPPEPGMTYQEARRRQAVADALMAERELQTQARELVRVDELDRLLGRHLSAAREVALGVAARLAPLLAVEGDPAKVHALIDAEMRRMLVELAEMPVSLKAGGGS